MWPVVVHRARNECKCNCAEKEKQEYQLIEKTQYWTKEYLDAGGELPDSGGICNFDSLEFVLANLIVNVDPKEAAQKDIISRANWKKLERKIQYVILTIGIIILGFLLFYN